MKTIEDAIIFAAQKHKGQIRRDGSAYIFHPLEVAKIVRDNGGDNKTQIVALLHDVLEDTNATEKEIAEFGEDVLESVKLLTKSEHISEDKYIDNILNNKMARCVKNADRIHNLWSIPFNGKVGTYRNQADKNFANRYIKDSIEHYKGRFSEALDKSIYEVSNILKDDLIKEKYFPDWSHDLYKLYIEEPLKLEQEDKDEFIYLTNEELLFKTKKDGFVYYDTYVWNGKNWLPESIDFVYVTDHDLFKITKEEANNFILFDDINFTEER